MSVQNVSGFAVSVITNDPERGPVRLIDRETTIALNGVTGRIWSVTPDIDGTLDPAVPSPGGCALADGTSLPTATLTLTLVCLPD